MLDLLSGFIIELRNAGLPVSLTENLDAMHAISHIPLEDREAFKYALGATLVKNNAHWRSFETVFEVYFSLRGPEYSITDGDGEGSIDDLLQQMQDAQMKGEGNGGAGGMDSLTPEELMNILMNALMNGDQALMRALARQAVQRFAGMEPGRPVGGTITCTAPYAILILTECLTSSWRQVRKKWAAISPSLKSVLKRTNTTTASKSLNKKLKQKSVVAW